MEEAHHEEQVNQPEREPCSRNDQQPDREEDQARCQEQQDASEQPEAIASTGVPGAFVIVDRKAQRIIGSTRFYGYDPGKSEIEIGWTFLARKFWGGRYNAEMKRLLLNHAFKFVESVVFFVGEDNVRSQKAMEKVGAIKVGTATRAYGNHPPTPNLKYGIKKT